MYWDVSVLVDERESYVMMACIQDEKQKTSVLLLDPDWKGLLVQCVSEFPGKSRMEMAFKYPSKNVYLSLFYIQWTYNLRIEIGFSFSNIEGAVGRDSLCTLWKSWVRASVPGHRFYLWGRLSGRGVRDSRAPSAYPALMDTYKMVNQAARAWYWLNYLPSMP